MRIDSILVENIKGIERAEFPLGSLTVIRGANATGKTSVLDAIRAVFDGGHDPSLIRIGADKGTVLLTLDNGTTIKRTITSKTSSLDIRTADGLKVSKPAEFVDGLASGFSYDPIEFLRADPKKQLQFLLEAMPISFLAEEIAAIIGKPFSRALGIEELNRLRLGIYDGRREVNVVMKQLDGTIASMAKALPLDDGTDWPAKVEAIQSRRSDLQKRIYAAKESLGAELTAALSDAAAELDRVVIAARAAYEAAKEGLEKTYYAALETEISGASAELQTVAADLATAEAKRREQDRSIDARKQIKMFRDQSREKQSAVNSLTAQLEKLDELKKRVLASSAIPGIEVVDGGIVVDGIPLNQVNTQRQYIIAFQIASLKQGKLPFMVCDRVESIVGQEWEDFREAATECGFQVLVARCVSGKALTVEADGEDVV